jgi:hypothetical protein
MNWYIVGYYTSEGRKTIDLQTTSREAARAIAYCMGLQVLDVSLSDQ